MTRSAGLARRSRSVLQRLGPRSRATLDNIALVWHYTTRQGIAAVAVVRLMPLLLWILHFAFSYGLAAALALIAIAWGGIPLLLVDGCA